MPDLTGTLVDNAFALDEQNLASILDLPFDGFYITGSILEAIAVDVVTPIEFVALEFFPLPVMEEVQEARGGPLPTRVREAQRIRQLVKLRKLLDDEEVLLLM